MDIRMLGGSGVVSAAVCALFIQYGTGSQASSLATAFPVVISAESPLIVNAPERFVSPDRFASPDIAGFLSPDGFRRPDWQGMSGSETIGQQQPGQDTFVVMIDPGHGGVDPGAKAHNGLLEKDLTLDIARRVRLFLSEIDDVKVLLTREYDYGLSRQSRVNAIRESQADMVISLHFNHLPQTDVTLVESYYAGPSNIAESRAVRFATESDAEAQHTMSLPVEDLSFTKGSRRLAQTLQQRIFNEVSFENPDADNAGVKQETLFVLTRSFTPGVLIEMTCISNVAEAEKLDTEAYRNRLAAALADGIRSYRDSIEQTPWDTSTQLGT